MFTKIKKSLIISIVISLLVCGRAFAVPMDFPFEVQFDLDEVDRLCYAGHEGEAVTYKEGIAITPTVGFSLSDVGFIIDGIDLSKVSAKLELVYENEGKDSSFSEVVRTFEPGSIRENTFYQLLSDNNILNLYERNRLYSDSLSGMVLTFTAGDVEENKLEKVIYLYVCSEDDYLYFYNSQE